MNRLIIIGNGFDLAHGLPTSYKHFIDDIWRQIALDENNFQDLVYVNRKYGFLVGKKIESYVQYLESLEDYKSLTENDFKEANWDNDGFYISKFGVPNKDYLLKFVNVFFKIICTNNHINNWVDIENEYYKELKKIVNSTLIDYSSKKEKLIVLNNEFEQIKNLLETYLNKIDKIQSTNNSILKYFNLINLEGDDYFWQFPKQDREDLERFQNDYNSSDREIGIDKITYCLNFNYTLTIDNYIGITEEYGNYRHYGKVYNLQIHGRLNDNSNRVNFGFGDEMDDDYKAIENLDDNEYLKNFKSFQYLQNSNYKTLLDFIDSEKFQVFIMGHSCGLSDRTLLNTVFEHNNCRSIKVFYHETKDENGKVVKDNYTEIIQNISRHFNKKKLMREKIVNKMLCKALPQIPLPKKE